MCSYFDASRGYSHVARAKSGSGVLDALRSRNRINPLSRPEEINDLRGDLCQHKCR